LLVVSVPDEGCLLVVSVPDEDCSTSASYTLSYISTFSLWLL
jgi:hypothetical protein